jgi:hypothetical protein
MTASSAEAGASIFAFPYANLIDPPFLRRNVRKSLFALTAMGSTLSLLNPTSRAYKAHSGTPYNDDYEVNWEGENPPAKRRRVDSSTHEDVHCTRRPLGQVNNDSRISSKTAQKGVGIDPLNFYGKPKVEAPKILEMRASGPKTSRGKVIENLISTHPSDFQRALKIDLLGISRCKDASGVEALISEPFDTAIDILCDCTVSIFCGRAETKVDIKCCYVKRYTLRISLNADGQVERRFLALDGLPLILSSKDFFINRNPTSNRAQSSHRSVKYFESTPDFADSYVLQIYIEPVGHNKHWPSLEVSPSGDGVEHGISLYCKLHTTDFFRADDQSKAFTLRSCHEGKREETSYKLELDISWSQANTLLSKKLLTPKDLSSSATRLSIPSSTERLPSVSLKRKAEQLSTSESPVGRSQRHRPEVPTYNLKALSAQAQGRSPRKQQTSSQTKDVVDFRNGDGLTVVYNFGKVDAAKAQVQARNVVAGLVCPFCACSNRTIEQLRLHLCNDHTDFRFSLCTSNSPHMAFSVEAVSHPLTLRGESQSTIQLGRPLASFHLEEYLNGDSSWVQSREGPQNNAKPQEYFTKLSGSSSTSTSSRGSACSSPDTSEVSDQKLILEPVASSIRIGALLPKSIKVPKTQKPLYHTITKRVLKPGDDLTSSDDEKDEAWLQHKHRDIIHDFSDIAVDEKEYINRWNPFITEKQYTIRTYLPRAMSEFLDKNKGWLLEKDTRRHEFIKQCQTFILQGDITEDHFSDLMDRLNMRERDPCNIADVTLTDKSPSKRRGKMDCVCGKGVVVAYGVTCRGKATVSFYTVVTWLLITVFSRIAQDDFTIGPALRN